MQREATTDVQRDKAISKYREIEEIDSQLEVLRTADESEQNKALIAKLETQRQKTLDKYSAIEKKLAKKHKLAAERHPEILQASRKVAETKQYFADLAEKNAVPLNTAVQLLSYWDMPISDERKAELESYTLNSPNGRKYAQTLVELFAEYGIQTLQDFSLQAIDQMRDELDYRGLAPSMYGESISWFLWDVAKQAYYDRHPKEADPEYTIGNPMVEISKLDEIVDRHLGWEIYSQYQAASNKEEFITSHDLVDDKIRNLLIRQPKPNGTLSSKDLAKLGALIR